MTGRAVGFDVGSWTVSRVGVGGTEWRATRLYARRRWDLWPWIGPEGLTLGLREVVSADDVPTLCARIAAHEALRRAVVVMAVVVALRAEGAAGGWCVAGFRLRPEVPAQVRRAVVTSAVVRGLEDAAGHPPSTMTA